jgi:hypothetical protein
MDPLLHADEPQSSILVCSFNVKAYASISDLKLNLVWRTPQAHDESATPLCFRALFSASCVTRKRERETSLAASNRWSMGREGRDSL